jgi:hypothetical protein
MQIPLYAQFAPAFKRSENREIKSFNEKLHENNSNPNPNSNLNSNLNSNVSGLPQNPSSSSSSSSQRQQVVDSDFLLFLKKSNFAPLELALKECEKRKPPLYLEMIFILGKIGE